MGAMASRLSGRASQVCIPNTLFGPLRVAEEVRSEWVKPHRGDHPVQFAGTDDLVYLGAVPVMEVAAKEVTNGTETSMPVRSDIDALPGQQFGRTGLIEEDEWPDHLPLRRRQGARDDERFDRVKANLAGTARFDCRVPTHASSPLLGFREAAPLAVRMPISINPGRASRKSAFGLTNA